MTFIKEKIWVILTFLFFICSLCKLSKSWEADLDPYWFYLTDQNCWKMLGMRGMRGIFFKYSDGSEFELCENRIKIRISTFPTYSNVSSTATDTDGTNFLRTMHTTKISSYLFNKLKRINCPRERSYWQIKKERSRNNYGNQTEWRTSM